MTVITKPVNRDSIVTLREITKDTVFVFCRLKVAPEQEKFVAPNAVSMAEAYFYQEAWFRGIYADEVPVGFLMLYDNPEKAEYFLWRFMIGEDYQKMGIGKKAMELLIEYVKTRPDAKVLTTSYVAEEGGPKEFYAKLGFVENGEMVEDEICVELQL